MRERIHDIFALCQAISFSIGVVMLIKLILFPSQETWSFMLEIEILFGIAPIIFNFMIYRLFEKNYDFIRHEVIQGKEIYVSFITWFSGLITFAFGVSAFFLYITPIWAVFLITLPLLSILLLSDFYRKYIG